MRTSCRISYRLSYRISYRITYRISHLLPANSDWAPAAAPWLCILPTGPVSAADSALLCLCSESRRGLQHTVFLFPVPGAWSARSGPAGAGPGRRGARAAQQRRTARWHRTVPVKGGVGGGRGSGEGRGIGEGGSGEAAAAEDIFTLTLRLGDPQT